MHQLIDEAGYSNDIIITSTVYDSIYTEIKADPVIIKWYNDNLIEVLTTQYLVTEVVHNEAAVDIGLDWANVYTLQNNATIDEISIILESLCITTK